MCIFIIAAVEIDNLTICEGGGTMYSCELNTAKTNISNDDVHWCRLVNNTGTTEMINPNGTNVAFTTKHSGDILITNLTITNAVRSDTRYYWVKSPLNDTCNVSVTVGTSM